MFWAIVCYTKEIQSQLEKARHFEHIPNLLNLLMGDWYFSLTWTAIITAPYMEYCLFQALRDIHSLFGVLIKL